MNHDESFLLSAYLDGELSPAEEFQVTQHLPHCASCAAELESLRWTKKVLAAAPRRAMPADLISDIEARLSNPWRGLWLPKLNQPRLFIPAGMLAATGLIVSLWLGFANKDADQFVPLEPLLAAHARYQAEGLVPEENMVAANYSYNLANADGADQD